jgi:hypothetical protein
MVFAAVHESKNGTREKRSAPQRSVRYVRYFCLADEATGMALVDPQLPSGPIAMQQTNAVNALNCCLALSLLQ